MSTSTVVTPPLTPTQLDRASSAMWETNLDDYGDVVEEMLATQRKIDRWIEIWQLVEKQLAQKAIIEQELYDARGEINMLEAKLRQMDRQAQDLQTQLANHKLTLAALEQSGVEQREANENLQAELDAKNNVIAQILRANQRAKRQNIILNHVKQSLLKLAREAQADPELVRAKALREVFNRYPAFSDLKQCRLVNRSMRQMATPLFRDLSAQIILEDPSIMRDFLELMDKSEALPTGDYKLDEACLSVSNEKLITRFFRLCCPTMHTLSLSFTERFLFSFPAFPRDLIMWNLRELFVLISEEETASYRRPPFATAKFLPSLLKASPNLEKFSLIIAPSAENKRIDKYGKLLQDTFESLGEKCKYLELDAQISDANLTSLKKANRHLVELSLVLKESNMSQDAFRDFLQSQAESLQTLKMIYDEPVGRMRFEFPQMENLRSLTLRGFHQRDSVEPMEYGKLFPSLQKFNFMSANDEFGNEWNDFFPADIYPNRSVTEMMLTLTRFDTVSYHRVGKIFPALRKLRLVVPFTTPEVQESLWCAMPNLEDLEYHLPVGKAKCLDELFTGIPAELCDRILSKRSFHDISVDAIRKRPSLTHLKYLKRLKLFLREHVITDTTGYLAFLQMRSLNYLELVYDFQLELTSECQRILRQRFTLKCRKR